MLLIKLVAIIIAVIAISKSYLDYRKKQEPRAMVIFWTVIWLSAATIVVYPGLIDKTIMFTRDRSITIGSVTGLAFIFMLYIIYRIYTKAARIEYQLAQVIRKQALTKGLRDREE